METTKRPIFKNIGALLLVGGFVFACQPTLENESNYRQKNWGNVGQEAGRILLTTFPTYVSEINPIINASYATSPISLSMYMRPENGHEFYVDSLTIYQNGIPVFSNEKSGSIEEPSKEVPLQQKTVSQGPFSPEHQSAIDIEFGTDFTAKVDLTICDVDQLCEEKAIEIVVPFEKKKAKVISGTLAAMMSV